MKQVKRIASFAVAAALSQIGVLGILILLFFMVPAVSASYDSLIHYLVDILLYPYILAFLMLMGYLVLRRFQAVFTVGLLILALIAYNVVSVNRLTPLGHYLLWGLFGITLGLLVLGYWTEKSWLHWVALVVALCCLFLAVSIQITNPHRQPGMLIDTSGAISMNQLHMTPDRSSAHDKTR